MSSYDIFQTVELLNFAANGVSDFAASQKNLSNYLNVYLNGGTTPINTQYAGFFPQLNSQLAGGDWKVVWGPQAYTTLEFLPQQAANAMYVAFSATLNTYVVAIAATNPKSLYDWIKEDGDVSPYRMAAWPITLPFQAVTNKELPDNSKPYISAATALGVSNLLTKLKDAQHGLLADYLQSVKSDTATLIFTGHSLAGALSPSVAMYLYPDPASSGWKNIYVLPTAGASPGNAAFAQLYAAAYPITPVNLGVTPNPAYAVWNVDLANANDIVPHAWNQLGAVVQPPAEGGKNYSSIFGYLSPFMGGLMTTLVNQAIKLATADSSTVYYQNLSQQSFTPEWGTWQQTWDADNKSWDYPASWVAITNYTETAPMTSVDELGAVILATHISQYSRFFNMVPPPKMATKIPSADKAVHEEGASDLLLAAARLS